MLCLGADDAEVRAGPRPSAGSPTSCAATASPAQPVVHETLERWQDAGAEKVYLQILDLADLEHLQMIADSVGPAFA